MCKGSVLLGGCLLSVPTSSDISVCFHHMVYIVNKQLLRHD